MKKTFLFTSIIILSHIKSFGEINNTIRILYDGGDYINSAKLIKRELRIKELKDEDFFDYNYLLSEIKLKLFNYQEAIENNERAKTYISSESQKLALIHQKSSIYYHWLKKDEFKLDSVYKYLNSSIYEIKNKDSNVYYIEKLYFEGMLQYQIDHNIKQSIETLNQSLELAIKIDHKALMSKIKLKISPLLLSQNQFDQTKDYLFSIKPRIDSLDNIGHKYELYKNLSTLYNQLNDNKNEIIALKNKFYYYEKLTSLNHKNYSEELRLIHKDKINSQFRKLTNNMLPFRGNRKPKIIYIIGGLLFLSILFIVFYIRQSNRLKNLNIELNTSIQLNKKIFSILSHDLKQPIYSLEAMFLLLDQNKISEEEKEKSRKIIKSHLKTTRLFMDDLMSWAKLEIEKNKQINEIVKPHEMVRSIVELYKEEVKDKNLTFDVLIAENLECYGDKMLLFIVFKNLIHNAIKFCFHTSEIKIIHETKNGRHHFSVINYGIPIPTELKDQMFEENKKLRYIIRNDSKLGFGLGLNIVSSLIKDNDGMIWISDNSEDSVVEINFYI